MAAPKASVASAASAHIRTPAPSSTINKPLAPMPGSVQSPSIFTNKEWIVPPRPKPGRKPAADAPPTKRKAQNREAQRAFRERRAAKVGELEEQMKHLQEQDQKDLVELRKRVEHLENHLDHYQHLLASWQQKHEEKEMSLRKERRLRQNAEIEIEILRKGAVAGTDPVPLPSRRQQQSQQIIDLPTPADDENEITNDITCGRCRNDTHCQCIEEAFEMGDFNAEAPNSTALKRPNSSTSDEDSKRPRRSNAQSDSGVFEIDFTAQFSSRRPPNLTTSASTSSMQAMAAHDRCGFCEDGTPCICAALQSEQPNHHSSTIREEDANSIANSLTTNGGSSLAYNPGTCPQCLSNPNSTLFCRSLAATSSGPTARNQNMANGQQIQAASSPTRPTLSCADAFTTLSRHPAFPQASNELGTWVSQLATVPGTGNTQGRTAFEIEAASVMGVLSMFDRRFGDSRGN